MDVNKEVEHVLTELMQERADCNTQEEKLRRLAARYNRKLHRLESRYMKRIQKLRLMYY